MLVFLSCQYCVIRTSLLYLFYTNYLLCHSGSLLLESRVFSHFPQHHGAFLYLLDFQIAFLQCFFPPPNSFKSRLLGSSGKNHSETWIVIIQDGKFGFSWSHPHGIHFPCPSHHSNHSPTLPAGILLFQLLQNKSLKNDPQQWRVTCGGPAILKLQCCCTCTGCSNINRVGKHSCVECPLHCLDTSHQVPALPIKQCYFLLSVRNVARNIFWKRGAILEKLNKRTIFSPLKPPGFKSKLTNLQYHPKWNYTLLNPLQSMDL